MANPSEKLNELRCPNCNDLIDTHHNPKNCYRCNTALPDYIKTKTAPFYSEPGIAALAGIAAVLLTAFGVGLLFSVTGLNIGGNACASGLVAVAIANGLGVYRFLTSFAEDG